MLRLQATFRYILRYCGVGVVFLFFREQRERVAALSVAGIAMSHLNRFVIRERGVTQVGGYISLRYFHVYLLVNQA